MKATSLRGLAGGLLAAGMLALAACDHTPAASDDTRALDEAAAGITATTVRAHVAYLAGDELRGRYTPSRGLATAADYIATTFRSAGLQPGSDSKTFLQRWPCTGVDSGQWPANVIALLPGSDSRRAGEWVVVSAHYDHVGVGFPDATGDSIYNGADDNASGTAGLLEVARALASLPKAPPRSVAFVAVSGEELGLMGSAYFVAHRPTAIGEMVADINLDMLGRNAPDMAYFIGDAWSSVGTSAWSVVQKHPELGLHPQSVNDDIYRLSDQLSFALGGVPALFLHSGSHPDLHRPSDQVQLLDAEKASRLTRLAFYLAYDLASAPERPAWTPAGRTAVGAMSAFGAKCTGPVRP